MIRGATQLIWRRHDLLRIRPDAWRGIFAGLPAHAKIDALSSWAEEGNPFIIRRYLPGETHDSLPAGVPLPPHLGKQRIAISFASEDVSRRVAPVSLRTAANLAPPAWGDTISALLDLGERYGAEPHVAGSLLWKHLTGLPYLTATSDLDLLWPLSAVCRSFLEQLSAIDRGSPVQLDGELALSDGSAVNWRELHDCLSGEGETAVLVKSMTGVQIQPAATILRSGQSL